MNQSEHAKCIFRGLKFNNYIYIYPELKFSVVIFFLPRFLVALNAVSGTWVHRSELEDSCNWVTFVHRRRLMVVLHNDVSITMLVYQVYQCSSYW